MPLTPDPPFPKSRNDTVRSKDWNDAVTEVIRLDDAKVDRAGDTLTGPLSVLETLGVGGPAGQRRVLVGDDVVGIGLDAGASPDAGYLRFGDNTGWKLHVGRSREAAGAGLNVDTTGVLATFQDNGNVGIGTTAPASRLQVKSLATVDEGATANGAWANVGSNAFFDGDWHRVDTGKAGVNLYMNGDGDGVEFRFLRVEADGSNLRNIAQIGTTGTTINEGGLVVNQGGVVLTGASPNNWKLQVTNTATGGDNTFAVLGQATADTGVAFASEFFANTNGAGSAIGVIGVARGGGTGQKFGVLAEVSGGGDQWAGWFSGNVHVTGSVSKGAGSFLIDHVDDPANKTLRHNFVESPEHLCLYRGRVGLDDHGRGTVELPAYFPGLTNEADATVYLTVVGEQPSPVSYRWNDEHTAVTVFGAPDGEVAYLVLAERDDPVIRLLGRPVEEDKGDGNFERGQLLYPEAFGHPEERGVGFALQRSFAAARPPAADADGERGETRRGQTRPGQTRRGRARRGETT